MFRSGTLTPTSAVLELGCGISPILGLVLAPRVGRYVLTDQAYVARFVEQNIAANRPGGAGGGAAADRRPRRAGRKVKDAPRPIEEEEEHGLLRFAPLDWEQDEVTPSLTGSSRRRSFDVLLACDCVYNEALVDPLVSTCAEACRLRQLEAAEGDQRPCVCVVAQQLRDSEILEQWLDRFSQQFRTWRVPDSLLNEGLRSDSGFVVHIGILK